MDEVLERGIVKSFPEQWLQKIVRQEFLKSKDQQKVDRLAMMAIKSTMHQKMMSDELDLYSQYIYKLIFKERIWDMTDFCELDPIYETSTLDQKQSESDEDYSRRAQRLRLRSDGPIMFSIISQELPRCYNGTIELVLTRRIFQICLEGLYIAEIPHRDGLEYDTYWAERFTKLVTSRYFNRVLLEMNGEDLPADQFNSEYMLRFIKNRILYKLPRVIPSDGWQQYISKERPVYGIYGHGFHKTKYYVLFYAEDRYLESHETFYWGYLDEED